MQAKDYYHVLRDFGLGKIDILAGTQMLAKGLAFSKCNACRDNQRGYIAVSAGFSRQ